MMHHLAAFERSQRKRSANANYGYMLAVGAGNPIQRAQSPYAICDRERGQAANSSVTVGGIRTVQLVASANPGRVASVFQLLHELQVVIARNAKDVPDACLIKPAQQEVSDGLFHVVSLSSRLRDQRHPVRGADQLLVDEFLNSEIGKLLSIPGPLVPAEGKIRGAYRWVIDKDHAGLNSAGNPFAARDVLSVNGSTQAEGRIISDRDRFLFILGWQDEGNRAEELLSVRGIVGRYFGQNGRLHERALAVHSLPPGQDLRAMSNCLIHLL